MISAHYADPSQTPRTDINAAFTCNMPREDASLRDSTVTFILPNPCRLRRPHAWAYGCRSALASMAAGNKSQYPPSSLVASIHRSASLVLPCVNTGSTSCSRPASGSLSFTHLTSLARDAPATRRDTTRTSALLCQALEPPDACFHRSGSDSVSFVRFQDLRLSSASGFSEDWVPKLRIKNTVDQPDLLAQRSPEIPLMKMGRLSKFLPLLSFGSSFVVARTTPATLRQRTTTTDVLATDVCGDVSAEFTIPGLFGTTIPLGHLGEVCILVIATNDSYPTFPDKCYCESQIPLLLTTDPLAIAVGLTIVCQTEDDLHAARVYFLQA